MLVGSGGTSPMRGTGDGPDPRRSGAEPGHGLRSAGAGDQRHRNGPLVGAGRRRTSPRQRGDRISTSRILPWERVGKPRLYQLLPAGILPDRVPFRSGKLPLMARYGTGGVVSRSDVAARRLLHQETNVELSAVGARRAKNCSGPVKASLLFRGYDSEGLPVAEAGVNAAALPATRFVTFAEQGEGQFGTGLPMPTLPTATTFPRHAVGRYWPARTLLPGGHDAQGMASLFGRPALLDRSKSRWHPSSASLNFEADPVFSSLPRRELDVTAQGPTTYYFSQLAVGATANHDYLYQLLPGR